MAAFEEAVELERREGNPRVTIELAIRDTQTYYKNQDDRDHWLEGYRKAGSTCERVATRFIDKYF